MCGVQWCEMRSTFVTLPRRVCETVILWLSIECARGGRLRTPDELRHVFITESAEPQLRPLQVAVLPTPSAT